MNRDQKAAVVERLSEEIRSADAIFAVDYRGISVADAAALRNRLRESQTQFRIVKNSLTERATDQVGADALKPLLEGPTALAFVAGDAALAAKALNEAARALGTLEFKGGVMNGAGLTAEDVRVIARLPARNVLDAQLVGTIAAPLSGLVRTLNALISGLAVQLGQIAEKGLVSGEAGEAPSASEAPRASEAEGAAEASGASASDADDGPSESQAEASEAAAAEAPEAEAAEAPAEVAEEAEAPAEQAEQTETEAASDAEASGA